MQVHSWQPRNKFLIFELKKFISHKCVRAVGTLQHPPCSLFENGKEIQPSNKTIHTRSPRARFARYL